MKLRHLIPLCFLALSPLAAAQELSATAVAEQLEQTATELTEESAQTVKKLKKDKKATKSARREAKKQVSSAKKRAELLRALANRLRDIEGGHASADEADDKGNTALMLAAVLGEKDAAAWLMNKGAKTELKNARGKTAAEVCRDAELTTLLRASVPPADWDELIARLGDNAELVAACTKVKEGGDINAEDGKLFCDMISCYYLSEKERREGLLLAKFFISKGADVNAGKGRILQSAVFRAYNEMLLLLLAEGADPTLGDRVDRYNTENIFSLISLAADSARLPQPMDRDCVDAYVEVIKTLLLQESIKQKIDKEPRYLQLAAVYASFNMSTKVLEVLLSADKTSHTADAAFGNAARDGKLWLCEFLNDKGVSPLGYDNALIDSSYSDEETVKLTLRFILEKGKPTQEGKNKALRRATLEKCDKTAETLRQHGAKAP